MPNGNGTGRNGQGPMTGRGMGFCSGNSQPGFFSSGGNGNGRMNGRGFRRMNGRGFRGMGRSQDLPLSPESDMPDLASRMDHLRSEMENLEMIMKGMETTSNS